MTADPRTDLVCPKCLSMDVDPFDAFACRWCHVAMVERMRLPAEDQEQAWTQLALC